MTLGVFSWSRLEPEDGRFELDWLAALLDRLRDADIGVNLATPSASPPWWLLHRHPEVQLVDVQGRRVPGGGRLSWCPTSPVFRRYATRVAAVLSERFGTHPAVRLWHISNELGNENAQCFCDSCAEAFRAWARTTYGSIDALNTAWGTAFWGHTYGSWNELAPPLTTKNPPDPSLSLAYRRFSSDALLSHFRAEADAVRRAGSTVPITTNMMIANGKDDVDNRGWAPYVDLVANDHYTLASDPDRHVELALSADRARGVASGRPWLLMEHSTSAVNWQRRNRAKEPGEMRRDAMSHIARGSDGAMFFQWRASTAGAEQFHSAMVPHAGTATRVWRDVVALGRELRLLAPVAGTVVVPADVALLWDARAHWAMEAASPHTEIAYPELPERLYGAFRRRGIRVDVVDPRDAESLTGYRVVLLPGLYTADDALVSVLERAAEGGAIVLITALSGLVDQEARVIDGGYPGAFRELLGVRGEELLPLLDGERVPITGGGAARDWAEDLHTAGAERVIAEFASGVLAGRPAVTARAIGDGELRYAAFVPDDRAADRLAAELIAARVLTPLAGDGGVDAVRRRDPVTGDSYVFCINHGAQDRRIVVSGVDLLGGIDLADGPLAHGEAVLAGGGVAVFSEARGGSHAQSGGA